MKKSKLVTKVTSGLLLCTMLAYTAPVLGYSKEEKVYTKIDTTGTAYNTIVSTHIKNEDGEKLINDLSDLINIENVGGDETFKQDGDSLVWSADGSDIYYEGESQKELPVECDITYQLDGKEISAKELAGKDGHLKMTIDYTNKDSHIVKINGKNETLYTPFVVVCGTIVENDKAKNIEVSSGKVQDNGDKTVVIGMALPGLQESLDLDEKDIEIPSSVEIEMDVTDFELSGIATYVTPKILEEDDLDLFDDLDEIYSKVDDLQDATNKLQDGANELNNGTTEYASKSQEFNDAMKKVSDGMSSANANYSKIDSAIGTLSSSTTTLEQGAASLVAGAGAISENLQTVSNGASTLNAGLGTVKSTANQIATGADQILTGLGAIPTTNKSDKLLELSTLSGIDGEKAGELSGSVATLEGYVASANSESSTAAAKAAEYAGKATDATNKATDAAASGNDELANVYNELAIAYSEVATAYGKAATGYGTAAGAFNSQKETNSGVATLVSKNKEAVDATITTLSATDTSSVEALKAGVTQIKVGAQGIANADTLYQGAASLAEGSSVLASKSSELVAGANSLYDGTKKLSSGTQELNNGSKQLKSGLNTLDSSTAQLRDADGQLVSAANTISDGVNTLAEGITQFKEEGIDTICDYINGDLRNLQTRIEKLQDLANEYNNFTMLNDGEEGSVNFIMIMDAIKKESNNKEEAIVEDNKTEVVKTETKEKNQ